MLYRKGTIVSVKSLPVSGVDEINSKRDGLYVGQILTIQDVDDCKIWKEPHYLCKENSRWYPVKYFECKEYNINVLLSKVDESIEKESSPVKRPQQGNEGNGKQKPKKGCKTCDSKGCRCNAGSKRVSKSL